MRRASEMACLLSRSGRQWWSISYPMSGATLAEAGGQTSADWIVGCSLGAARTGRVFGEAAARAASGEPKWSLVAGKKRRGPVVRVLSHRNSALSLEEGPSLDLPPTPFCASATSCTPSPCSCMSHSSHQKNNSPFVQSETYSPPRCPHWRVSPTLASSAFEKHKTLLH